MKIADLKAHNRAFRSAIFRIFICGIDSNKIVGSPLQVGLFWGSQPKEFGNPCFNMLHLARSSFPSAASRYRILHKQSRLIVYVKYLCIGYKSICDSQPFGHSRRNHYTTTELKTHNWKSKGDG